jgi:hypothetical protein
MPSPTPDDLSPEEEQVRRLLADARHTEPVPEDVAARLDAVLADLRHEDAVLPGPVVPSARTPVDLAARRRRRAGSWLIAAAAVVAVGVGYNQLGQLDTSGGGSDNSSAGSADQGAVTSRVAPEQDLNALRPVRLDPDRFGAQVARLQRTRITSTASDDGTLSAQAEKDAKRAEGFACSTSGWGRGRVVPVRYDGQPAVLVFRKARGDTQVVDLFRCGRGEDAAGAGRRVDPFRSITLPAP